MNNNLLVCASVAIGPRGVIGKDNVMPWYSRQDFYHFRTITTPYPCIFGRNTYENMPKTPLPNRLNIVCSSKFDNDYKDGVFYASSLESAIDFVKFAGYWDKLFICGGSAIYKYALEKDLIDVLYLTKIKDKKLRLQVMSKPDSFCYFPYHLDKMLVEPKWTGAQIFYDKDVLPTEVDKIKVDFFRYLRVRQK